jgi:riboflavin kinase/FMN adenylyltransferase
MQLMTDQEIRRDHGKPMVVALGSFDGIHKGHQIIIRETVHQANAVGGLSGVFTFHPHPLRVLAPERASGLITALPQKMRILNELGVDCLVLKTFSKDFANTDFRSFVEEYLVGYLKVKGVVVGEDFRFGRASIGNVAAMQELGKAYDFKVTVFETIRVNGVEVRSTLIRELVQAGRVDELETYLGRPYTLAGRVTHGDGRGRHLGFPTANVTLNEDYIIPRFGVYAVYLIIDGVRYPAVANIGVRPTFQRAELSIEVHVMDVMMDLYGRDVEVEMIKMLRAERRFESVDELVRQITDDANAARQTLYK